MAKWCVRGLVAGPRLPRDSVKLSSSCSIKRITEPEHQVHVNRTIQLIADRNFIASQFGNPDVFNYTMPLTQQAESKHELSIIVTADNPPLAVKKAEEEASLYLGVLTLAVGTQRYFFSPTVARHLPDVSSIYAEDHATSGIGRATVYHAESLRVSDADYAKTL